MRYKKIWFIILAILALGTSAFSEPVVKEVADGITLYQDITTEPEPLVTNVVRIDLANPAVHVKAAIGRDMVMDNTPSKGREIVSSITARKGAVIGVNADFFPFNGDPNGICISDGELISEPWNGRPAFGLLRNGLVVFDTPSLNATLTFANGVGRQIDGINRGRETNQLVVYTPTYGDSTLSKFKGTEVVATTDELPVRVGCSLALTVTEINTDVLDTKIPKNGVVISAGGPAASFLAGNVAVGDKLRMVLNIKSASGVDWTQMDQAVGGGPWLIKSGNIYLDYKAENFKNDFARKNHPRTAIGVTSDNKLLIVTVDGRQSFSSGLSLQKLAEAMKILGACQAINLDGGGSTTLSIRGTIVNSPSGGAVAGNPYDGGERAVADMLLVNVEKDAAERELSKLKISGIGKEIESGEKTQLYLTWGNDDQTLTEEQLSRVVWGCTKGIGFIDQNGYFNPIMARTGTIDAFYGDQKVSIPVTVIGGQPAGISISAVNDKLDPRRTKVKATVTDQNGNFLANKDITLTITNGIPNTSAGKTDKNGTYSTDVVWDITEKRIVKAVVDEVSSEISVPNSN
ncbi:phosphodiester glycosidase family protein [bacterium]|nr:phosphodiester glycosidase family protein [bacterium]